MKSERRVLFATIIAVLLLHLSRNLAQMTNPILYGEEGKVFFLQAYELGWSSLFKTYAGYLHTYPRIYALLFSGIALPKVALVYHFAGLGAQLLLIYAVIRWATHFSLWAKIIAVLSTILIPHAGEVYLNLPNTINILGPIPWLLILAPNSVGFKKWIDAAVVFLAAVSGPYILLATPLILWTLFRERRFNFTTTAALLGLAVQLCFLQLGVREQVRETLSVSVAMTALNSLVAPYFFGWVPFRFSLDQSLGLLVLFFGICGWRMRKSFGFNKEPVILLLGSGLMVWGAGLFMGLGTPSWIHPLGAGQRYFWAPYVMITLSLLDWSRFYPKRALLIFSLVFLSGIANWGLRIPTDSVRPEYRYDANTGFVDVSVFPEFWNFGFRPKPEDVSTFQR